MQYIRLTNDTLKWFLPLLPPEEERALLAGGDVYAIGAVRDESACGILVFSATDELVNIRYLAVSPSYRRKGIARGMLQYLCKYADTAVTPVTCVFPAHDKQEPVYLLFAGLDTFSVSEEEGYRCRLSMAEVRNSPRLVKLRERGGRPRPFFELPAKEQKGFFQMLFQQDIYYLREIPKESYVKPLCLYTSGANGSITSAVFMSELEKGSPDLELNFAWAAPGRQNDLIGLLAEVSGLLLQEGDLWISAVNPVSASMVDKLLPDREITDRFYRASWDMEL